MTWVRIRRDLVDGRAVQQLLELRLERGEQCASPELCLGWLVRVLVWGDAHCDVTGVTGVTPRALGRVLGDAQVIDDLVSIGWLRVTRDGLVEFVDWEVHNSQSSNARGKNRTGGAARQARYRQRKREEAQTGDSEPVSERGRYVTRDVTGDVTRDVTVTPLEKRREEEKKSVCPSSGIEAPQVTSPAVTDGPTDVPSVQGGAWPEWVPEARRPEWTQAVEDGAFALTGVRSSPAYRDGVRQALAQLTAPTPGASELALDIRGTRSPVPEVLAWLRRLEGRPPAYVTAALRSGPLSAAWQDPRLAAEAERSKAYSARRAEHDSEVARVPERAAGAKSGASVEVLNREEVRHAAAG